MLLTVAMDAMLALRKSGEEGLGGGGSGGGVLTGGQFVTPFQLLCRWDLSSF